jgi:hypothetical protein
MDASSRGRGSGHPTPITGYEVRDAAGELVAVHNRRDLTDDGKQLWWETPDGTKHLGGLPLAELPLYGIDRLGRAPTVVIAEGEKAADALQAVGIPALGTVTGAASCPGQTPLGEVSGRDVVLWADHDEVGRGHMAKIGKAIAGIAADVRMVGWPNAPEHGDAADYVFPAASAAEIHAMAEAVAAGAAPFEPTEPRTISDLRALLDAAEPSESKASPVPTVILDDDDDDWSDARSGSWGGRRPSQATQIVTLARATEALELFHSPDGVAFVTLPVNAQVDGGHEPDVEDQRDVEDDQSPVATVPLRSRDMRAWLGYRFYAAYESAAGRSALDEALDQLEAIALYEGQEHPVFLRVAEHGGARYLDLGDRSGRAIEITADGWRLIDRAPIRFRRSASAAAFPEPVSGGSLDDLRDFLTASDEGFRIMIGWAIQALRGSGPYAVGVVRGEQGSAKTTGVKILRSLVDPATASVMAVPRQREDLLVAVQHHHVVAIDNVSSLPDWLSDDLAMIATGGAFSLRRKYTDLDELALHACRPLLLNGIEEFVTRGDLLDRTWSVDLPVLPDDRKRPERDFWDAFGRARPAIFGALLDAIVAGLGGVDGVVLKQSTRMVDAARFVAATEETLGWPAGTFADDLVTMRAGSRESVLEASPLTVPLGELAKAGAWRGTAAELLNALESLVDERARQRPNWPRTPRALGGQLRRVAPELRSGELDVVFDQRESHSGRRLIVIGQKAGGSTVTTVTMVTPSPTSGDDDQTAAPLTVTDGHPDRRDEALSGDGGDDGVTVASVDRHHELVNETGSGDGGDGRSPFFDMEKRDERTPEPFVTTFEAPLESISGRADVGHGS